jgi:hypothetical protein
MPDALAALLRADPFASVLVVAAGVGLLAVALSRSPADGLAFWPWLRRLVTAAATAALLLGLVWFFRTLLDHNAAAYAAGHEQLSRSAWERVLAGWGRPHSQGELSVTQFVEVVVEEQLPPTPPARRTRYRSVTVREPVAQNSLAGFDGQVVLTMTEPQARAQGAALYNTFEISATYAYDVVNGSDQATQAEFAFPLPAGQLAFRAFGVSVDGRDIGPRLRFEGDTARWSAPLAPHARQRVVVRYAARGMDGYTYQVPVAREIRDFRFQLAVNTRNLFVFTQPAVEQTRAAWQETPENQGVVLTWTIDRLMAAPQIGVALSQPEQPYAPYGSIIAVLRMTPVAVALLVTALALTALLLEGQGNLLDVAVLGGAYAVPFLLAAGAGDAFASRRDLALVAAAVLAALLALFVLRWPGRLRWKLLAGLLVAYFAAGYPLFALLDGERRSLYESATRVGLSVYLLALVLYRRLGRK